MIHRATFRAFVASTEDEDKVRKALSLFVPPESISSTRVIGHYGNRQVILESVLEKNRGLKFLEMLREQLPGNELDRLHGELGQRVDEKCHLYLRLDKQAAYESEVRLTDQAGAIQVSIHLETYPARRENAVKIAREIL